MAPHRGEGPRRDRGVNCPVCGIRMLPHGLVQEIVVPPRPPIWLDFRTGREWVCRLCQVWAFEQGDVRAVSYRGAPEPRPVPGAGCRGV